MTPRRTNRAFTLTELLVVICVIGILAGLILAGLSATKNRSRQALCAHNVSQLGLALQEFVTDYHVYPRVIWSDKSDWNTEHTTDWRGALEKVIVPSFTPQKVTGNPWNSGVWLCPSASQPVDWPENYGYDSYGYNARGLGDPDHMLGLSIAWKVAATVNESAVASPSDMLALGDSFQGAFENGIILDGGGLNRRGGPHPTAGLYGELVNVNECTKRSFARHSGKANMFFCDGHTTLVPLNSLFVDTSDASLARWNRDHQPHRDLLSK